MKNNERGWTNSEAKPKVEAFGLNNKHEALFCCGRNGVNSVILSSTHALYVAIIAIIAFKLTTLGSDVRALNN